MAEATVESLDVTEKSAFTAMSISARNPARRRESSTRRAAKTPIMVENQVAHGNKDISGKDVLKGLKIICAASAGAELDA